MADQVQNMTEIGKQAAAKANEAAHHMLDQAKEPVRSAKPGQEEGTIARAIEQQTAKLPSDMFLWVAGGSMLASLMMKSKGKDEAANFVGQWVPTLLILGVYNKMVKLLGSDGQAAR